MTLGLFINHDFRPPLFMVTELICGNKIEVLLSTLKYAENHLIFSIKLPHSWTSGLLTRSPNVTYSDHVYSKPTLKNFKAFLPVQTERHLKVIYRCVNNLFAAHIPTKQLIFNNKHF